MVFWLLAGVAVPGAGAQAPGAPEPIIRRGVSAELASERARTISDLRYELFFRLPASPAGPVSSRVTVTFRLSEVSGPLVLDFDQPAGHGVGARVNGRAAALEASEGHLLVPAGLLAAGENAIDLEFIAGDDPLNRNPGLLYTLFVPARAHQVFPCFDQPDLKARWTLTLDMPDGWQAVANGAERARDAAGGRAIVRFEETQPLPTYLFGFAAGDFRVEQANLGGRAMRMFHRETDATRLLRNREAIFDLHASALEWLENYTGIPYPFGKLDFVLLPSFQFGGMEHAGKILYNADRLLLDESATQNQLLGRASLIAHETAHMWFGDLVTMEWFDDVWLKEVFANFMAAKIVNPAFPDLDHDLRFLFAHHPLAYEVDRSAGANAIRQRLDNLAEAGSLYGAIIYQKAPVVMRQLERIVGEAQFREGLREYLRRYGFGNATWQDLIGILDARTREGLVAWSRAWVEEPGRPHIRTEIAADTAGRIETLAFVQSDPRERGLLWGQEIEVVLGSPDGERRLPVYLDARRVGVPAARGLPLPRYVLPAGGGLGYGYFELDPASRAWLLAELPAIPDALTRGAAWVTLWDALLEREVAAGPFLDLALRALGTEEEELNVQRVLGYLEAAYWRYQSPGERERLAPRVEPVLRDGLARASSSSLKAAYLAAFRDVVLTSGGLDWLEAVWRRTEPIPGLTLAENDEMALAQALAVREVAGSDAILRDQLGRITNPDRRERFAFVMPALSADPLVRERFFASLGVPATRRQEPWVLEGLAYLHHPLRTGTAEQLIRPGLDLLREIQRTGDIFFPKRWLDATLRGHSSARAAGIVRRFLDDQVEYPPRLRQIILQSADGLFRAAAITSAPPDIADLPP